METFKYGNIYDSLFCWTLSTGLATRRLSPSHLAAPITLRGGNQIYERKHLRAQSFKIAFLAVISSLDWQCTKRLYKAARSSSILGHSVQSGYVSLSIFQHTCKLFCDDDAYPKALFCKFCLSERRLQQRPTLHRHKVKLTGFSCQGLNQLMHALNGNIYFVQWNVPTPRPRSSQWRLSFTIPNGMVEVDYSFYGNQNLWIRYYRRGVTSEAETNRSSSPRLYGMMLRSVASRGGGPGSRWTHFRAASKHWTVRSSPISSTMEHSCNSSTNTYEWNHLNYEWVNPLEDIYDIDDEDDRCDWSENLEFQGPPLPVQSGYQDRCALRGTHRGTRSPDALARRFTHWKSKQVTSRRDFRAWKSHFKDSTLRTHGDQNPKPLVCPKPAVELRLRSQAKSFKDHSNRLRSSDRKVALPVPAGFDLNVATWNVEGLRETSKSDQIPTFSIRKIFIP